MGLAVVSRDPSVVARYNTMALEHLQRAVELDATGDEMQVSAFMPSGDDGSDMDRD